MTLDLDRVGELELGDRLEATAGGRGLGVPEAEPATPGPGA